MSSRPTFSVVMPTYNRANRIRHAISSVLAQTEKDFELVISNGGSTDETRLVVESFSDRRIKYVESNRRLTIGENYLTAFSQATGLYVTFLSDDDAFLPQMLEEVKEVVAVKPTVEVVVFRSCLFTEESIEKDGGGISLSGHIPVFDNGLLSFSSEQAIENVLRHFGLRPGAVSKGFNVSYLANAVYHSKVFAKVRERKANLFEDTPADAYLAAAIALNVTEYFCLDAPLHVWTEHGSNATAVASRKRSELLNHYEKLLGGEILKNVPFKCPLPLNCTVNAVLKALDDFGSPQKQAIDWPQYYLAIYQSILDWESYGVNVDREVTLWKDALEAEDEDIQSAVCSLVNRNKLRLKRMVASISPRIFRLAQSLLNRYRSAGKKYQGNDRNFQNVYDFARFAGTQISKVEPV